VSVAGLADGGMERQGIAPFLTRCCTVVPADSAGLAEVPIKSLWASNMETLLRGAHCADKHLDPISDFTRRFFSWTTCFYLLFAVSGEVLLDLGETEAQKAVFAVCSDVQIAPTPCVHLVVEESKN
jgi:hypothetical protein